ncbi:MAG: leucine-rich repeat protein [Acutalibacteraceae bacterium]
MKKALSVALAILLIISGATQVFAATLDSASALMYEDNGDGTCTVTSYRDFKNDYVVIPSTLGGLTVTKIGDKAFQQKTALEIVKIPDTVTEIGNYAFYGCTKLNSVGFGADSAIKTIGDYAFNGCKNLTDINIRNAESVGKLCFYNCVNLNTVTNYSLKTVGERAFWKCEQLNFFRFKETLEVIEDYAFSYCIALTELVFPDSLRKIGNSAFSNCTAVTSVTFGEGELEIGNYAFENCTSLTEVTIPKGVTAIGTHAFSYREPDSTEFVPGIKINCYLESVGVTYAIKTGAPVYIIDLDKTVENFGDFDGNGKVDTLDARKALKHASATEIYEITDETLLLCDFDRDGTISVYDVNLILQKVSGIK